MFMDMLLQIFGDGEDLNTLQMCCRSIDVFIIALGLIRIAGRRSFGQRKPLDNVIVILLGSVLARAVAGVSPFVPTVVACLVFALLHRVSAWASIRYRKLSKFVNGEKILVYNQGAFDGEKLTRALIHEEDVLEQVRLKANVDSLDGIDAVYMEKNGELSTVKK